MNSTKRAVTWLVLLLACAGVSVGSVVGVGGLYPSPYVDDWSDVDLRGGVNDADPAIAACLAASGRAIFREGVYRVTPATSAAVTLAAGNVVQGAGMGLTILRMDDDDTGAVFLLNDDCTIADLTIDAYDDASTLGARALSGKHRSTYLRVEFSDLSTGLQDGAATVNGLKALACKFTSCATGMAVVNASTGVVVADSTFNGNTTTSLSLSGGPVSGRIVGNLFVSENTAISMGSASYFTLSGNTVLAASTATLSLGTATNCDFGINNLNLNTPTTVSGTRNTFLGKFFGNAAPASGTWQTGDVVWDISPTSADPSYFQCSAGGSPGTWKDGPDVP